MAANEKDTCTHSFWNESCPEIWISGKSQQHVGESSCVIRHFLEHLWKPDTISDTQFHKDRRKSRRKWCGAECRLHWTRLRPRCCVFAAAGTVRAPNKAIAIVNNFCPESVEPSATFLASAHSCRSRVHSVPSFLAQTLSLERSSVSLCFVYLVNPRR